MKVSGFTILRNAVKLNYPVLESICSILPICDEFIVNVGDSDDRTLELIRSLQEPKIKIIQNNWDLSKGTEVLSQQTNLALEACTGDWAFYIQADEVVHERDLWKLRRMMQKYLHSDVDALRFEWLHFFGSYYRYRDDYGWYQKQDRIIRNNGTIESFEDAYTFRRKDRKDITRKKTGCFIYHYGWVYDGSDMTRRLTNHEGIGFNISWDRTQPGDAYNFGDLRSYPMYFGSHPKLMRRRIKEHLLSKQDRRYINSTQWWNPFKITGARYKRHRGLIRQRQATKR